MNLKEFIANFRARKGVSIFFASIIEKIGGFLLVLIVTHFVSKGEFGFITYANTSLTFIIPFIGFGIHQGLVRYGSLANSQLEKKYLFNITLKKGLLYSFFLMAIIVLLSPLISRNLEASQPYIIILSMQLVSLFVLEIVKIYIRLVNLNKLYAKVAITNTVVLVLTAFLLALKFEGIGYVLSLSFVPLFVAMYYIIKLKLLEKKPVFKPNFKLKEFLSYGMFSSLGGVLSQLLYAVDILLIGNLITNSETLVAQYKVSNILPFSFLFLALVFMKTDFVKLANKSKTDKEFIKDYYYNYLKIFSVITVGIVIFFFVFSKYLILLFGSNYTEENNLMFIFSMGVMGALLFRVPLGNILSAIGWPKINALNSFVILLLNISFSYVFIMKYGIVGAAIVTAALMWISGFLSLFAFWWYLKKDKT